MGLDRVAESTQILPGVVGSQDDHEKAKELLDQIVELFEDAERTSVKLKPTRKDSNVCDTANDLDEATASLHKKLEMLSLRRVVNGLVELFPAARQEQKRLCEEDGSELASDKNTSLIAPFVAEQDPELSTAIKSNHSGGEQIFNITFAGSQNYGLQQGYFSGQQTNNFGGSTLRYITDLGLSY
ncbi:uncharacterized protein Z518_04819 [Rhinocladiella mackenziei CBS 650.93]|uniref:Fungal death-pathway protein SesB domain-containing protein n=1 Tax=Rhinocladiella mackenziei CBS 650.93 TaxID=1442369 RepID=A0A0D2H8Q0_9EURO|nr:uncharacterized protein Z518_04819 [Rhinocladiella mackenziei CBS 650.93]KIX06843.1 hypothetical protein Z518_04819 [Rhinocladiella mackenziei CBS 650.93]